MADGEVSATPAKVSAEKHKTVRHRMSRTVIEHHNKGGHTIRHEFTPMGKNGMAPMGAYKPDESLTADDNAGLLAHMSSKFPSGNANASNPAAAAQEENEEVPASEGA
jgi:hypothetical protein